MELWGCIKIDQRDWKLDASGCCKCHLRMPLSPVEFEPEKHVLKKLFVWIRREVRMDKISDFL